MKSTILLLLTFFAINSNTYSQPVPRSLVPEAIKDAFNNIFPNNPRAIWTNEKDGEYMAEVKLDDVTQWITFEMFGNVISTKTSIPESELPEAVANHLKVSFEGYKISNTKKVEHAQHSLCYEAEIKRGPEEYIILIDPAGNMITKEEKKK